MTQRMGTLRSNPSKSRITPKTITVLTLLCAKTDVQVDLRYPWLTVGNRGDRHASHGCERDERSARRDDFDVITRGDDTAREHDPHDPGCARELAALVAVEHRGHEARRER